MGIFDVDPEFVQSIEAQKNRMQERATFEEITRQTGLDQYIARGGNGGWQNGGNPTWTTHIPSVLDKPIVAPNASDPLSVLAHELPKKAFNKSGKIVELRGTFFLVDDEDVEPEHYLPLGLTPHAAKVKREAKLHLDRRKATLRAARAVTYFHLSGGQRDEFDDTRWSVEVTSEGYVRRWTPYSYETSSLMPVEAIKKWRYDNGF